MVLGPWLEERIWPLEGRFVDPEFVADGRPSPPPRCFGAALPPCDMYFFPEVAASVALKIGLRPAVLPPHPIPHGLGKRRGGRAGENPGPAGRIPGQRANPDCFGPHSTYALAPEHMIRIATLAGELVTGADPSAGNGRRSRGRHESARRTTHNELSTPGLFLRGCRPCTSPRSATVTRAAPGYNVSVVHCPQSNLKLASGFAPVARFQRPAFGWPWGRTARRRITPSPCSGSCRSAHSWLRLWLGCHRPASAPGPPHGHRGGGSWLWMSLEPSWPRASTPTWCLSASRA